MYHTCSVKIYVKRELQSFKRHALSKYTDRGNNSYVKYTLYVYRESQSLVTDMLYQRICIEGVIVIYNTFSVKIYVQRESQSCKKNTLLIYIYIKMEPYVQREQQSYNIHALSKYMYRGSHSHIIYMLCQNICIERTIVM